jgi:plastocyanin
MIDYRWLSSLLLLASTPVLGGTFTVLIGDDCDDTSPAGCFFPRELTIRVGDTVQFFSYSENVLTGNHNVVADDGSFRCARGCDDKGGDGTPVSGYRCDAKGGCIHDAGQALSFARRFQVPGVLKYHDEVGGATGTITVIGPFAIGAAMTGSWYDPAQNGHGFQLEVLPGNPMQLLAAWFAFAPQGGQAWIVGQGPIDGNRAVVQGIATAGSGARFPPNFDATNVHVETWGTLTFTFSDCNRGRVEWASTPPGYGSGGMDLARLTLPAGLKCISPGTY